MKKPKFIVGAFRPQFENEFVLVAMLEVPGRCVNRVPVGPVFKPGEAAYGLLFAACGGSPVILYGQDQGQWEAEVKPRKAAFNRNQKIERLRG